MYTPKLKVGDSFVYTIKMPKPNEYLYEDSMVYKPFFYTAEPPILSAHYKNCHCDKCNNISLTKNIMSNIVKFAKNLTLSSDEKLLRKLGLKDENGNYTQEYMDMADELVYKEKEKEIIEIAKKMDAENNTNK